MNLHQFRFVQEAVRRNLNLTETAKALYTSQPGISKAIIELEEELGVEIFARHGKRLRRITEPGQQVLKSIELIMREVGNLKRIGEEYHQAGRRHAVDRHHAHAGALRAARAGGGAAQALPQGAGEPAPGHAGAGGAHAASTTAPRSAWPPSRWPTSTSLVTLPCYEWQHVIVVPAQHPLATVERPTLEQLAAEPLVTYHPTFTGRTRIDAAFARAQLKPMIALEAIDSDVIKTYVRLGLGIGIVAEMAVRDDPPGGDLASRPAGHLFGSNVARVAFKRGAYLRQFV